MVRSSQYDFCERRHFCSVCVGPFHFEHLSEEWFPLSTVDIWHITRHLRERRSEPEKSMLLFSCAAAAAAAPTSGHLNAFEVQFGFGTLEPALDPSCSNAVDLCHVSSMQSKSQQERPNTSSSWQTSKILSTLSPT